MNTQTGTLQRAQDRMDKIDWEAIYLQELPRVYNYFRYRVGAGPQAEDLTAATFEKAWRNRQRYRRDLAAFSTWLFTIARRVAGDHYRRRRVEVPLEAVTTDPGEESLEGLVQRKADFARLQALLARLPIRERELVALHYGAGLTNRAIARLSGLSESNVGTILHRVAQHLRSTWEAEDE
ncbi:MAG: sigma-70 family RNA polymerase sigma factor [Anaerolineales bacterium]|nr:sigma-70 family RNA polymerase sigma factor [Anaerolineales bacterium]